MPAGIVRRKGEIRMQKIFQEYGGVITVAVAIVALVGVVGMLIGNGGFMTQGFNDVVEKFEDKVGTAIESTVTGENSSGEGSASTPIVHNGIIPEGGTYSVYDACSFCGNVFANGGNCETCYWDTGSTGMSPAVYTSGQEFPELSDAAGIKLAIYEYGDYKYFYTVDGNMWCNATDGGWFVTINESVTDRNQTSYGDIITTINGANVTAMYNDAYWGTFSGCMAMTTAPAIPAGVTDMSYAFADCTALTGEIEVNANLLYCEGCFDNTTQNIKITGSCSDETKANLASTANNGNVTY